MALHKTKKMVRQNIDATKVTLAICKVLKHECSIRAAADSLGVNRMSLQRYIKKYQDTAPEERKWLMFTPNHGTNVIFSPAMEEKLKMYLITVSKMHYGLARKHVMQFAYQLAVAHNLYCPRNWYEKQAAGESWCLTFMKRHPELTLSKPEGISYARCINRATVNIFYDRLESAYEELGTNISSSVIYNLDETIISTVHNPTNAIASKGETQDSQVTACCIIAANGTSIPPYLVFPIVHYKEDMLNEAPPGSRGGASKNGCMNAELFFEVLQHFQEHARASVEKKVLLLLDNHESHITIKSLDFCEDNGIVLLTLAPHTYDKLQPLHHTVYKTLRSVFKTACNERMVTNVSKTVSIYEVPELFGITYDSAFTPENIKKGFQLTGIWRLDRNICKGDEFLCCFDAEEPAPVVTETASPKNTALISNRNIDPGFDVIELHHNNDTRITALEPVSNV